MMANHCRIPVHRCRAHSCSGQPCHLPGCPTPGSALTGRSQSCIPALKGEGPCPGAGWQGGGEDRKWLRWPGGTRASSFRSHLGGVSAPTSPAPGHVLGREAGLRSMHPQHPASAEHASRPRRPEGETLESGAHGNCWPQAQPDLPQLTVGDSGKGTGTCQASTQP